VTAHFSTDVYLDRLQRARRSMEQSGVDVLLVSVGPDLPYLAGYSAMPLERLTMLVVPRDGDATLVIPRLEAPRVVEQPGAFKIGRAHVALPILSRRLLGDAARASHHVGGAP